MNPQYICKSCENLERELAEAKAERDKWVMDEKQRRQWLITLSETQRETHLLRAENAALKAEVDNAYNEGLEAAANEVPKCFTHVGKELADYIAEKIRTLRREVKR